MPSCGRIVSKETDQPARGFRSNQVWRYCSNKKWDLNRPKHRHVLATMRDIYQPKMWNLTPKYGCGPRITKPKMEPILVMPKSSHFRHWFPSFILFPGSQPGPQQKNGSYASSKAKKAEKQVGCGGLKSPKISPGDLKFHQNSLFLPEDCCGYDSAMFKIWPQKNREVGGGHVG